MLNISAVNVLSLVALCLTLIILVPQVYFNYQNASTEGVSSCMMQCFLFAAITSGIYDVHTEQAIGIILSWYGFATMAIICLCQDPYYQHNNVKTSSLSKRRMYFLFHFALCACLCVTLYYIFAIADKKNVHQVTQVIGYIAPAVLNVLGYLMQFHMIVQHKSSEGISLGFMMIDTSACVVALTTLALDGFDGAAASPFICILTCQIVLLSFRLCIYPPQSQKSVETDESIPAVDDGKWNDMFDTNDEASGVDYSTMQY
jgi:uncharacterized protein with PQ loop repeat